MSGTKLSIRLFTKEPDLSLADGEKVLRALRTLLTEVERSITGKEPTINWQITAFRYECDGCGCERPAVYGGWQHWDDRDYCPTCLAAGHPVPL